MRDRVDVRMSRHPGMTAPLDLKRLRLAVVLRAIARARPVRTYRQALADLPRVSAAGAASAGQPWPAAEHTPAREPQRVAP
jgi:hypothetical protein